MQLPRKTNRSGRAATMAFQTGCGFSWLSEEPKAIRAGGSSAFQASGAEGNGDDGKAHGRHLRAGTAGSEVL